MGECQGEESRQKAEGRSSRQKAPMLRIPIKNIGTRSVGTALFESEAAEGRRMKEFRGAVEPWFRSFFPFLFCGERGKIDA
jgi:hypothetical protein